jgi:hypothetical protein
MDQVNILVLLSMLYYSSALTRAVLSQFLPDEDLVRANALGSSETKPSMTQDMMSHRKASSGGKIRMQAILYA